MLGIGFKVSDTTSASVQRPLREFLEREYAPSGDADASDGENKKEQQLSALQLQALDQFEKLKADVDLVRTPSTMSRHVLLQYYAQLDRMALRFPADSLRLPFTWNDSFCPRKKITQPSLFFEMAAVMFNYGALESQLGVQTDRSDADGLKAACKHFMLAAGAFAMVSDQLVDKCVGARTPDTSAEGLSMLSALMLAQAQACFYEKAIKDQMKDAIKAKLVHHALEQYTVALECCNSAALSGTIDRMWSIHILFQVFCMKAAVQYWAAKASKEVALSKGIGYGEEIARLQAADIECQEAVKVGTQNKLPAALLQSAKALQRVVQEQLQAARKDNASIYLENVPKLSDLPPVGKASMVKPLLLTPDEISQELHGVDLFEKFVPNALIQRAAQVKEDVKVMLTQATETASKSTECVKQKLHTMGLPASIEAFEKTSDNGIPQSIWNKISTVQSSLQSGGMNVITATQQQLQANDDASERAEKSLREIESKLSAEEVDDNICRQNYGQTKWSRPQSAALNDGFRLDVDRYYRLVKEAKESDKVVSTKLRTSEPLLQKLSLGKPQLDAQLPLLEGQANCSCKDEIAQISTLLLQVTSLMDEKDHVLKDFSASHDKFNVLPVLLNGTANATVDHTLDDEKSFFQTHFVAKIDTICAEEVEIMNQIVTANAQFELKRASDHVMVARQAYLQQLCDALEIYDQLQSHLKEGAKFYDELATRISQLQQTVDDHCAARDLERRELEMNVQNDDEMRKRESHDAAVAAQMMRDMQLTSGGGGGAAASDEAFARQLAGGTPQLFGAASAGAGAPSSGMYGAFQPQQPPQQWMRSGGGGGPGNGSGSGPSAPGFAPPPQLFPPAPAPPAHPYAAYQQQPHQQHQQQQPPPPAYNSIFSSSPSSTPPQFGNYYYAQQQQQAQQPPYPPQTQGPPQQQQQPQQGYGQYPGAQATYQQPPQARNPSGGSV